MSSEDRKRWEGRHLGASKLTPRESVRALPRAPRADAIALDLACGQGRHVAPLCEAGYHVVAMDISMTALAHARASLPSGSTARTLALQADIDAWPFAAAVFDLIVQVDFLERRIFPSLRDGLRPGGLLLIDTFLDQGTRNAEGPSCTEYLLAESELPHAFADFELLRYDEMRGATARGVFLARKP
ncbi:MAG TPA: class I SAM-dependent methyltransferase [Candidatus Limnocylindrales bacterium]|nr:class I SAM-dependent methyltransferase [Candidatus Limnocylindrales bacterium]